MFSDFVKFLQEEYGDTLTVVSQTDNGSDFVVADDFNLIDMDHVAVDFARNPRKKDSRRKRKSSLLFILSSLRLPQSLIILALGVFQQGVDP